MAVALDVTLPDNAAAPGIGNPRFTPLGGDGWTAPQSVFEFGFSSPCDASGGENTITVTFDPRFVQIVTYVRLTNAGASTTLEMEIQLRPPLPFTAPIVSAFANAVPINGMATQNEMTWSPPPVPTMRRLVGRVPNVNGDTLVMSALIYNFNIRVLELVPLNLILGSLPRGDSTYPVTGA